MSRMNPENKDFSILVVDDEIEYQRVFSLILSRNGFRVLTCSDGESALEILSENEIDLVMTDLKMPGMDGITLIQKVKENYSNIEIMIVTAYGSIESAVQAMKYGATGYFIKSSDPDSLLLDINRMVIGELLEDTLERFNTCHCEKCRSVAEKLLLGSVSVRIVTVSGNGKRQTDEYFNCARKEIYSALVKLIIKNKRRPFHDMDI